VALVELAQIETGERTSTPATVTTSRPPSSSSATT